MSATEARILETIVTPSAGGAVVQLQIPDAPLDDESWAVRLTLAVKVPAYRLPLLAHVQREAINIADSALTELLREMATELQNNRRDLHPTA